MGGFLCASYSAVTICLWFLESRYPCPYDSALWRSAGLLFHIWLILLDHVHRSSKECVHISIHDDNTIDTCKPWVLSTVLLLLCGEAYPGFPLFPCKLTSAKSTLTPTQFPCMSKKDEYITLMSLPLFIDHHFIQTVPYYYLHPYNSSQYGSAQKTSPHLVRPRGQAVDNPCQNTDVDVKDSSSTFQA